MKLKFIAVIGTFLLSAQAYAGEPLVLKTEKDKLNYGIRSRSKNEGASVVGAKP